MTAVTIRKASSDDIPAIRQLFKESDRYHCDMLPDEFKKPGEVTAHRNISGLLEQDNFITLVAEQEDAITGFVQGQVHEIDSLFCLSRRIGYIHDIVVTGTERNRGTGSQLILAFEKELKQRQVTELMLNVYSFNKEALSFYQKHGYSCKIQVLSKMLRRP